MVVISVPIKKANQNMLSYLSLLKIDFYLI